MTKRIISFILAVILAASVFPRTGLKASAEPLTGTSGDCTWTLDTSTATMTISGYGDMADYTASETKPWAGYGVYTVIIESSVTSIGDYAFYNTPFLRSVKFSDSDSSRLNSIGDYAFARCSSLTSIDLPDSGNLSTIGAHAFDSCTGLRTVSFPNTGGSQDYFRSINEGAFYNCTSLGSVNIPGDYFYYIGDYAFYGCKKLSSVTVCNGEGDPSVGKYAFSGCTSLADFNAKPRSIGEAGFEYCSSLKAIHIPGNNPPQGTTIPIRARSFYGCSSLTSITIPADVFSIDFSAFRGCTGLTSITVEEGNTAYHSEGNCIIDTGNKKLVLGCQNSVIPDDGSVTSIGKEAFAGCKTLTSLVIPDTITSIGAFAFSGCTGLQSLKMPFVGSSRTSSYPLGYLFHSSSNYTNCNTSVPKTLTTVEITDSDLSANDFANCQYLTTIVIGEGVQTIDKTAFQNTPALEAIIVDENNPNYCSVNRVLYNKDKTELIWYPANYKRILQVNYLYTSGEPALESVIEKKKVGEAYLVEIPKLLGFSTKMDSLSGTMPDDDITIDVIYYENEKLLQGDCNASISWTLYADGMLIFRGTGAIPDYSSGNAPWAAYADQVKMVYIDPRITGVGAYAFEGCANLTFVDYGYSVKTIGAYAFSGCSSLTSFKLPDSVTTIAKGTFSGCTGLRSVVISDYVTSIADDAFAGCSALVQVTMGGCVSEIGNNAFADCPNLTQVYFRGKSAALGSNALGSAGGKYVYYYSNIAGWNEVITDGYWQGYLAVPYNAIAKESFTGTNVYIIKVVDKHNAPLVNAAVDLGGSVQPTNDDGMAYFVKPETAQKLTVSCSGHNAYVDDAFAATTSQIMDIIELSDKPSSIQGVSCNGRSIATSVVTINCATDETVQIRVRGISPKYTITHYELLQENRLIATVKTNKDSCLFEVSASVFEEGKTLLARMYTADGNVVSTALNLDVVKLATVSKDQIAAELSNVNIGVSLGDFGPMDFELPFSNFGLGDISVSTEGRSIFVGINLDVHDLGKNKISKKAIQKKIDQFVDQGLDSNAKAEVEVKICGYVEIEYLGPGDYYIKSSYVKMSVGLKLSAELHASFYGIVGVYFKVTIGASGALELHISRFEEDSGFKWDQCDLTLESMLELEGGVFLLYGLGSAGVFGNLTIGFTIGMLPTTELKTVYVTGDLGIRWKVGWGLIEGQVSIGPKDIYRWPEDYSAVSLGLYAATQDPNAYTEHDRSYLENRSPWLPNGQDGTLQKNIYEDVSPKVVVCGDTAVMVWLDDNSQRDNANFQMLYYSVCRNGVWSEPAAIYDNETFDCEFDVYTDGEKVYVLYTEMKDKRSNAQTLDVGDASSMEALALGVEVNVAVYENGAFGAPVRLTDNNICEQLPAITEVNGVITATWLESNSLGVAEVANGGAVVSTSLGSTGWDQPATLVENQKMVSDIAAASFQGKVYYAYIADADGSGSTVDDKVLVLRSENGDAVQLDTGSIANVAYASIAGVPVLAWYNDGNVYMIADAGQKPVSLMPENVSAGVDYQILSVSEEQNFIFFTQKNYDQSGDPINGTDVYGMYVDINGALSAPVRMTKTEGYVSHYSVYSQGEELYAVFTETFAQVSEDRLSTVSDFKTTAFSFDWNIAIDAAQYDIDTARAGSEFAVSFTVSNNGTNAVDGLTLNLYDAAGNLVYTAEQDVSLESGAKTALTVTFVLPAQILADDYAVEILPKSKMATVEDSEPENNCVALALAYTDMSICAEQKIIGEKNYIIFSVTNDGNIAAAATLSVHAENSLISELKTDPIAPGATEQYLIDIHALTDETNKILTCSVSSHFEDPYPLNDTDSVYLLHIDDSTLAVAPEDAVRNPALSVTVANFDKYAPQDVALEILAEAESFVSIEGLTLNTDYSVAGNSVTIKRSYLATLSEGTHTLNFLFDFGNDTPTVRSLTVVVSDSTPISVAGSISIIGEATAGTTLYADISKLSPKPSNVLYTWSVDNIVVSEESSYTVRSKDCGKNLSLTVVATDGYRGVFTVKTVVTLEKPDAPSAPVISKVDSTSIVLVRAEGIEYSLDGATWQTSHVFDDLLPNETYTVYARNMATETNMASDPSVGVTVTTQKQATAEPEAPVLQSASLDTITLTPFEGMEYRIEGGQWTENNVFTNLQPNTAYVFYQRYKETASASASNASSASFATLRLVTISGAIVSYGAADGEVIVKLMRNGSEVASVTTTNGRYDIALAASSGEYQLVASKQDHVVRTYDIEVSAEACVCDMKLCPPGDVTGDGRINFLDYSIVLAQAKGQSFLQDYALACADANGDGLINYLDYSIVLAWAKGKAILP